MNLKHKTFQESKMNICFQSASGTGLAFIIFTEAINQFPGAQFWSVLFFLMLFTLGIDSQFGTLEGVVTSIVDMKLFPNLRKEILTGSICLVCCIISMAFAHGAGSYIFVLFDNFSGNFPLLIIAFFECIGVSYVYGIKRQMRQIIKIILNIILNKIFNLLGLPMTLN